MSRHDTLSTLARVRQRGFSLVSAIFLLVVLAGLGVAMVNVSTVQHTSSALDAQGGRAYQAARAGIEWGLFRLIQGSSCAAQQSFVPPAPTLNSFTVTVKCAHTAGAAAAQHRWTITSTACNQPAAGGVCPNAAPPNREEYVQRIIDVDL